MWYRMVAPRVPGSWEGWARSWGAGPRKRLGRQGDTAPDAHGGCCERRAVTGHKAGSWRPGWRRCDNPGDMKA